ncbi:ATPase family gene 2 protein homolog A-like [Watersipora subatra]|uniref:ATPase family gene 2 protein homolog A-like n=1 Tax=Watersipora subatra TaxID=2589382 RepID=UPI00355C6E03
MRVAGIPIGHPIVVNGKCTYLAWPNSSISDCFIYIPLSQQQGQLALLPGQRCTVNRLPEVIPSASFLKVTLGPCSSSLPSSVTEEHLSQFIKRQLFMRIVSSSCELMLSYFGKPLVILVEEVQGEGHDDTPLSEEFAQLDLTTDSAAASERITSSISSTPTTGNALSKDTPILANGLNVAEGHFYQVNELSRVSLIEGTLHAGKPQVKDEPEKAVVVAGVDDILETLSRLIIEPISKRSLYDKYGVQVAKGVLLYGPSGCGKTLISEVIRRELKEYARFITLDSSRLWSKQFGETEGRIQEVFQQAIDSSPSVVFIDDIDVICPRRERSQSDLEKRVLSALVTEIDRSTQDTSRTVFILSTTSRLDAVDMTLRRPGRIDLELEVPIPSSVQRKQIVSAILGSMLHSLNDDEIGEIATDCHGYVGADLQSLCREAGLSAMRSGDAEGITPMHLKHAMSSVQPSAMREIYIDVPKVRWTDIGGQEGLKQSLIQAVVWPLQHADKFKKLGIKPPRGVLMYGPPGCSKTMIAKALATETSLNFISIKGPELFSKWVGESEKAVREIFRKARNAAPSIIFFDEIDAVAVERGRQQGSGGGVGDRVLAQLLTEMDGVEGLNDVNIVAATNRPDMIDKALMRPGRLDRLVYVPLPDHKTREEIFKLRLSSVPLASDVCFKELVKSTELYSGAEIVSVCNEAAIMAMQEDLAAEQIRKEHIMAAIGVVKPQTTESMVKYYTDYAAGAKK